MAPSRGVPGWPGALWDGLLTRGDPSGVSPSTLRGPRAGVVVHGEVARIDYIGQGSTTNSLLCSTSQRWSLSQQGAAPPHTQAAKQSYKVLQRLNPLSLKHCKEVVAFSWAVGGWDEGEGVGLRAEGMQGGQNDKE